MFDTLKRWLTRSAWDNPKIPLSDADIIDFLGGSPTRSGQLVSVTTALQYSPVWQAVDLISSDISRIPFLTYRRVTTPAGEGKERDRTHPAYPLLRRYNGEMNANMWLVRMIGHALLHGNAYTRLRFTAGGRLVGFEWLHSDLVQPRKQGGQKFYLVTKDPTDERSDAPMQERVPENEMFHLEGLAIDLLGGLSIVKFARDTIGRGRAAEGYGDDYFLNGGPSVIFSHPGQMSDIAQKRWIKAFRGRHTGQGNRFKFGIAEEGMTPNEIGLSAKDAQLIEGLQFSVKDVARFFNLPPHKLGDDSRTAYNSTEQENMAYFNSSLGKWTSRLEFEGNQKLFSGRERTTDSHFCEFLVDALFKANTADRMTAAATAITNGIKSRNEVRAEENLNPYEGGDKYLVPLNLASSDDAGEEPDVDEPDDSSEDDVDDRLKPVIMDAYERAVNRLFAMCKQGTRRRPEAFAAWLNSMGERQREPVREIMTVSLRAAGAAENEIDEQVDQLLKAAMTNFLLAADGTDIEDELVAARTRLLSHCRKQVDSRMETVS